MFSTLDFSSFIKILIYTKYLTHILYINTNIFYVCYLLILLLIPITVT